MSERSDDEEAQLLRASRRWVLRGRRYRHLMAGAFVMPRFRQRWFQWRLRRAGRRAPAEDLAALLEGGGGSGWPRPGSSPPAGERSCGR